MLPVFTNNSSVSEETFGVLRGESTAHTYEKEEDPASITQLWVEIYRLCSTDL